MKQKVKRILGCAGAACVLALALAGLSALVQRKNSDIKYQPFFDQKADFDVLFLGTSHMLNAVYPLELWQEHGIVSYNLAGHGSPLPLTYWVLRNALDYTTPKAVVIDCYELQYDMLTSDRYEYTHISLDAFPLSLTKLRAALDLLPPAVRANQDPAQGEKRTLLGLLWDFSVYHSRWQFLEQEDFDPQPTRQMGADVRLGHALPGALTSLPRDDKMEGQTRGLVYLERMITECQARGIQVLLTYLPFPAGEDDWRAANRVYDVAEQYGVPYINFLTWDGIDYLTDCCDSDSHLNYSGGRKVTAYLGDFLARTFAVPDRRAQAAYADWNAASQAYRGELKQLLARANELPAFLALADNKSYDLVLVLEDDALLTEEPYASFLRQMGGG